MTWRRKPLAEVAMLSLGKMLDERKNRGELLPYLANVNVRWGEFSLDGLREMRFESGELERCGLRYGDIVMCEGGEPGRCAVWKEQEPQMLIQKALHRIRPLEMMDAQFLFYALTHLGKSGALRPLFTGATIKHLPREKLELVQVPQPPLSEQRRLADVLSAYDDLIANNQRRITLLEEAARHLYREWFVRLRFPGAEHIRIVDGVPEGWERSTLGTTLSTLEDGDWIESKDQGGDDFRLLQVSNVGVNDFVETGNYRFIDHETFRRLHCREVREGQLLISRMPDPIGRAWLVREMPWRMVTAVDVAIAEPDTEKVEPLYLVQALNAPEHFAHCAQRAIGATRARIPRRVLAEVPLVVPSRRVQQLYVEHVAPMASQREVLERMNSKLRTARDLLLPRLMSGQLAV